MTNPKDTKTKQSFANLEQEAAHRRVDELARSAMIGLLASGLYSGQYASEIAEEAEEMAQAMRKREVQRRDD